MAGRGTAVATAGKHLFAWLLGVGVVVAPYLAIDLVDLEVDQWADIYVAGAVGGLALEMLLGRGRLELPGPSAPDESDPPGDNRRPFGPLVDLGFFARVSSSGIAAAALLLVYYALVGEADTAAEFDALAEDPSTFGWAVFLGVSSPAVWTLAQRLVEARIAAAEAVHTAKLEHLNAAVTADANAALTQVNSSLTTTITAAAAELRAAEGLAAAGIPGALAGAGAGPVVDATAVAPAVEAGVVLGHIEEVVGEAAAAEPGDVDVESLSLALFERLPAAVAGLTGPPAADVTAPVGPTPAGATAYPAAEPPAVAPESAPGDAPAAPPPAAAPPAPPAGAAPVQRALQILEEGVASA
jgi:hypothetical protein